jgi:hypothetical protein
LKLSCILTLILYLHLKGQKVTTKVFSIVKQALGCLTLFFTVVKIISIQQCHTGGVPKSQLRRQGSKAKDQHGRGLDDLQKQVRRFYIYQKLKVPYF